MPKSVDIADFAAKLDLICKRLNWSRGKLAQEVAIDKSLAGRWVNGVSRPTGNTLMRLNEAVARSVSNFSGTAWTLSTGDFAALLGIAEHNGPAGPLRAAAASTDALSGLRALATFGEDIDKVAPVFCGFYRGWFASLVDDGGVMVRRARAFRQGNELRFELDGAWQPYRGVWFLFNRVVYMILETPAGDAIALGVFKGPYTNHPRHLAGFIMSELRGLASGGVSAAPAVAEFIAPLTGDPEVDAATWASLAAENRHIPVEAQSTAVPAEILDALRHPLAAVANRPERLVSQFVVEPID
jgi:transcriptional regulator with XRE-family HTH domain